MSDLECCGTTPDNCDSCKEKSNVLYSRIKTREGVVLVRQDDGEMQKVVGAVYDLDIENMKLKTDNEQLKSKLEKAEKALGFYADFINWDGVADERENRVILGDCSRVTVSRTSIYIRGTYGGKLARQTLKEIRGEG